MKKFAVGLAVVLAGLGLGAQEAPIALRESFWPEPGRLTEMLALHDLRGGVYIPYIAEDTFTVLRAGGGGELSPYMPEGFDGVSAGARKLKAIDSGSERQVAFIGRNGEEESIQLFGFGFWEDLSYYPLPETKAEFITDYALVPSINGVMVYTLAGGHLRSFSTGINDRAAGQPGDISRRDEKVEAFEVQRHRSQEMSYGWYRVAHNDAWEIILFSLDDAGNLVLESAGAWSAFPRLEHGVSPEGKAVFAITAGSAVAVYHAEGARFAPDLRFDAPFAAKRYSPALLTGASAGLLIGETEEGEVLYGVSHELSGAPALGELFAAPSVEILELFALDNGRISLMGCSDQILFTALIHSDGSVIADKPLPGASPGAVLFRDSLGKQRVYAVSESGAGEFSVLSTLELEGETWRLAGETRIPRIAVGEVHSINGVRSPELLLLVSSESLVLLETETSAQQILEAENHGWTIALNGVVYVATSSEEGIVLRRIEGVKNDNQL
jgi:hypothetical protein